MALLVEQTHLCHLYGVGFGKLSVMAQTEYVSLKEYAEQNGVSLRTIHRWLKQKIVKAKQPAGIRGKWLIEK